MKTLQKSYLKNIKGLLLAAPILAIGLNAQAQLSLNGHFYGEDALLFSSEKITGTARTQGMGGNYSSIGADASNAFGNPAGLGFYNRSELSITPVFTNYSTQTNYIGNTSNASGSGLKIGQFGLIMNSNGVGTRKKRSSFAITYSTHANFLTGINYQGVNNRSSMSDYFAEKATQRGANTTTLDNEFNPNTGQSDTQTSMYYQSYLIDPLNGGGYGATELSTPVNQAGTVSTMGKTSQFTMGYGANFDDRTYIGASLGIVRLNYETINDHNEAFPKGQIFNGFNYNDDLVTRGSGINLSVGAITKVTDDLQFGVSVTTPTAFSMSESYYSSITIDNKPKTFTTDFKKIEALPSDYSYKVTTPLKANAGFTFFLPKKLGFITADAQYVGYRNMGVRDPQDTQWSAAQKSAIQSAYKDVVNLKIGGEIRINQARLRAGINYLADPVRKTNNSQIIPTIGAGYRTNKFFFDVAGVFNSYSSSYTPYQLNNISDYASAAVKTRTSNFVFSVGTFF